MKRYDLEITDHDGISASMEESHQGPYVLYEDVKPLIEALKKSCKCHSKTSIECDYGKYSRVSRVQVCSSCEALKRLEER